MESNSKSRRRESQDMISNLPDSIIAHILSFLLSTKQAALTSVLSKRWIYIWTFVNKLSFDDSVYFYPVSFFKFVNRVLFHFNTATIQEFHLSISQIHDSDYINQWIYAVLNRGVKKINVCSSKGCYTFCFPLFKCQSLEELVFETWVEDSTMKLPSFLSLPSLTILKLSGIKFTSYSSNEFKDLTLNFPLLREFVTRECTWSDLKSITIRAPLLESVLFASFHKPDIESQVVKFCATQIKKFTYECPISSQTILLDHQQIPSARLDIFDFRNCGAEESWIFIHNLLSFFINAEYLDLCFENKQMGIAPVEHYLDGIPTFQMLTHLHISFTSDILLDILLKSPCLETLVLKMIDYDEEPQDFAIVPDCFISTLKVVKFDTYFGGDRELSFAKFVMENAKVLENISFPFPVWKWRSEAESAKKKLSLIKINSSKAIMNFEVV